jgi:hypothetical protein
MAFVLNGSQSAEGTQIGSGICMKGSMDWYWGGNDIMGMRTLHQGMQDVSSRDDDHFSFSSQHKERFLKN